MSRNNQSNNLIKWMVSGLDFLTLNFVIFAFYELHWRMSTWVLGKVDIFFLICNMALLLSMLKFSTIIHLRMVGAGEILKKVVQLTTVWALLSYLILKTFDYLLAVGWLIVEIGTVFAFCTVIMRLIERKIIKYYRELGWNTRWVTLVGSDPELIGIYRKLKYDATLGYRIKGYYGDVDLKKVTEEVEQLEKRIDLTPLKRLGSLEDFMAAIGRDELADAGDELYLCVSRQEKEMIRKVSRFCDQHVVRFYYVPVSVETIGLNLKREYLDDIEIYSTYENPLENPANKLLKRVFDIVLSIIFLIPTALIFPIIYLIIKIQSPGPIFFKQVRTGLDGKDFYCYKFRSMHVNKDADRLQATKDDPRKYPFGNFMRKANIDELPQFWNVLKGDMSIVGPRPHMLAHTEQYSALIGKYMVRHFVKPGVTGWAQVTGFRGETKELWQMEGRVLRDIWYMEHWSIWLDMRIIWLTAKTIFVHDKNAY